MKRFIFGFLAVLFLILNTIPYLHIMADDMPTNSQYEMLGAYALSTLITSGEATELDFSDYTDNDTSFLIDLGEAIFTGDWSGLAEDGLEWLGETADSVYDSYKEYISQWKSEHLGIMYSNWFPDEEIYVGPDDSYSLAKPLRELFTPRGDSTPTPNPDSNYESLLANITKWQLIHVPNWSVIVPNVWVASTQNNPYGYSFNWSNRLNYTYAKFQGGTVDSWDTSGYNHYKIYSLNGIHSFYIDSVDGGYKIMYCWNCNYNGSNLTIYSTTDYDVYPSFSIPSTTFGTLNSALTYLVATFKNFNLYVDNVPWVLVDYIAPTYPIVIPGQMTIYNNQPLEYTFPDNTHIDLPDLTNIIRNAINSSGVVMWSDIADVFVDINGQTAVSVTKIVRNDYDNLYMEQYPYPAMLVGMTDQTKFNEHLLDNSHAYLSPMGTVVQETVNVLPSELVGVLAIGAILTIFAVIINRLLE